MLLKYFMYIIIIGLVTMTCVETLHFLKATSLKWPIFTGVEKEYGRY